MPRVGHGADDRVNLEWPARLEVLEHRGLEGTRARTCREALLDGNVEFSAETASDLLRFPHHRFDKRPSRRLQNDPIQRCAGKGTDRIESHASPELGPHLSFNVIRNARSNASLDHYIGKRLEAFAPASLGASDHEA